jgi:hypothetical protein
VSLHLPKCLGNSRYHRDRKDVCGGFQQVKLHRVEAGYLRLKHLYFLVR